MKAAVRPLTIEAQEKTKRENWKESKLLSNFTISRLQFPFDLLDTKPVRTMKGKHLFALFFKT